MLSERLDVNKIACWLKFTILNLPITAEVITDGSKALANAVCLAFNKMHLTSYVRQDRAQLILFV